MNRWCQSAIWLLIPLVPLAYFPYFEETHLPAKWIVFYLAAFCAALGAKRSLSMHENVVLIAALASMLVIDALNGRPSVMTPLTLVAFCGIYSFAKGEVQAATYSALLRANLISAILVMIFVAAGVVLSALGRASPYLVNPLGHGNYLAEFLALTFGIQLFEYLSDESRMTENVSKKWIRLACVVVSLAFVLVLRSRAALAGLCVSMVLICIFAREQVFAKKIAKTALVSALILGPVLWIFYDKFWVIHGLNPDGPSVAEIKSASAEIRRARWMNTVEMIREKPFGYGSTGYEWGYLSFSRRKAVDIEINKAVIATSPHNIILEIIVKCGVHVLVGALVLFVFYLRRMHAAWTTADKDTRRRLEISLIGLSCTLTIAFFSIPFDTAVMNAYFAFFLALGASPVLKGQNVRLLWLPRGVVAAAIVFGVALYAFANWSYSRFNQNYRDFVAACQWLPEMSENCIKKAYYEKETTQDSAAARQTLLKILEREPNHFVGKEMLEVLGGEK